jgi:ATP-dependent helicase HepA
VRRPDVRLVRPGFPFVDAVERFLRWDDRGAAFATWRMDPARPAEPGFEWLGFRLCYVVEADHEAAARVLAAHGFGEDQWSAANLRRRADALLPPWLEVRHVDAALVEVHDPALLELLKRPYDTRPRPAGGRDYNLGSRWDALTSVIAEDEFAVLCRRVREHSERLLRESDAFQTQVARAAARARAVMDERSARLRRRAEAIGREGGRIDPAIAIEIAANEAIVAAVEYPAVRLDAIGFFVLAGYPPPSGARR